MKLLIYFSIVLLIFNGIEQISCSTETTTEASNSTITTNETLNETTTTTSSETTSESNVDPDDLLTGKGFFNEEYLSHWVKNSSESVGEVFQINGTEEFYFMLEKEAKAELSFEDGFILNFNSSKPKHIRFYFAPSFVDNENTNLRLKNTNLSKTVVSFRCGNAGFLRVNDNQMVDFYNSTVSNKTCIIWSKMDLILNWDDEEVKIYLNDTFKGTSSFYHPGVPDVDQLMLYNLKPGTTSFWKGLQVCETQCEGFSFDEMLKTGFLTGFLLISIVLLII